MFTSFPEIQHKGIYNTQFIMDIEKLIASIEKTYTSSSLIYESMLEHFLNLDGLPFYYVPLKRGSYLIRARYKNANLHFEKPEEFSYPPSEYVCNFSRLNRPRQSLFYASETENSCFAEMIRFWGEEFNLGDKIRVGLGKWRLKEDIKVIIVPDPDNKSELNINTVNRLKPLELEFWRYISEKFKTTGLDDKNIYEFTSAFSNALYLNGKKQDKSVGGFIYSSVQSPENLNLALNKELVDSDILNLEQIAEMQCTRLDNDNRKLPFYTEIIGLRRNAIIANDKIIWK